MNRTKASKTDSIVFALAMTLFLTFVAVGAENPAAGQETSADLLLKIMDLHSQLVTNEVFVAQAKMLGAYLEAAQPLEEAKKVKIYTTVLHIITKIKESPAQISAPSAEKEEKGENKAFAGEEKGKSVFVPGAALLEIFKAESIENIPKLPVIRTYWERDLSYSGGFLVPDRFSEIGRNRTPYVARFSFYYEAKEPGDYGFTLLIDEYSKCRLTVGGVDVVKITTEQSSQGVCNLIKGFHRFELWFISQVKTSYQPPGVDVLDKRGTFFEAKVLTPNALDAVPLTKDMMLLKADQKRAAGVGQAEKAKGKSIPYIDY